MTVADRSSALFGAPPGVSVLEVSFDARGTTSCELEIVNGPAVRTYRFPGGAMKTSHRLDVANNGAEVAIDLRCESPRGPLHASLGGEVASVSSLTATRDGDELDICWESTGAYACSGFTYDVDGPSFAYGLPPSGCLTGAVALGVDDTDYTYVDCVGLLGSVRATTRLASGEAVIDDTPPPPPGLAIEAFELSTENGRDRLLIELQARDAERCTVTVADEQGTPMLAVEEAPNGTMQFDVDWAAANHRARAVATCTSANESVTREVTFLHPVVLSVTASKADPAVGETVELCWETENVDVCTVPGCGTQTSGCCSTAVVGRPLLWCTGPGGEAGQYFPVSTEPAVVRFVAEPALLPARGGTTTISWTTAHVASCDVIDEDGAVLASAANGSVVVEVQRSQRFALLCDEPSVSRTRDVRVGEHPFREQGSFFGRPPYSFVVDSRGALGTTACALFESDALKACLPRDVVQADEPSAPPFPPDAPDPDIDRVVACAAPDGNETEARVATIRSVTVDGPDANGGFTVCVEAIAASFCDVRTDVDTHTVRPGGCAALAGGGPVDVTCSGMFSSDTKVVQLGVPPLVERFEVGPDVPPGGGDSWVAWAARGVDACELAVGDTILSVQPTGFLPLPGVTATTALALTCDGAVAPAREVRVGPTLAFDRGVFLDWRATWVDTCVLDYTDAGGVARQVVAGRGLTYQPLGGSDTAVVTCTGPFGSITSP